MQPAVDRQMNIGTTESASRFQVRFPMGRVSSFVWRSLGRCTGKVYRRIFGESSDNLQNLGQHRSRSIDRNAAGYLSNLRLEFTRQSYIPDSRYHPW